jgi:hypothetical protein
VYFSVNYSVRDTKRRRKLVDQEMRFIKSGIVFIVEKRTVMGVTVELPSGN